MVAPRPAKETVQFIDKYCEVYKDLFLDVRSFECFKYLHLGLITDIKRKTFPEIAKVVGLKNGQVFDYFFGHSPWSLEEVRKRRINLILGFAEGEAIPIIIDETGDRKKGRKTDYVARQYIGNLGKVENGIVEVTAYGIIKGMTVPLISKVYKPQTRLKEGDVYKSKPEIGGEMIKKLKELGFNIKIVLADSEYGESDENFVRILEEEELEYVLSIRSNHGVWLGKGERVRANRWRKFERKFSSGETEIRYVREIIYGKRREKRYWQVTDDKEKLPPNSTYFIMTRISSINYKEVGNLYGIRNWVEYGLKQIKNELGWADFRMVDYSRIEKWREIVMSVYLMVSLQTEKSCSQNDCSDKLKQRRERAKQDIQIHPWWNKKKGWKNILNNMRLIIQPWCYFNLLKPWMTVIYSPQIVKSFYCLFDKLKRAVMSFEAPIFGSNYLHCST